ncbi:hypothetical protein [Duganella callida]|uniref:Uncharacterized protein n=1 Tax=Duganella callida TaxID=2561932 RepID=A0A4Y9SAS1_9BURK|nr:hypothetical protein [Duganella callida]TFW17256.1 hypothetical protein E4L98_21030 [Duganella callida]
MKYVSLIQNGRMHTSGAHVSSFEFTNDMDLAALASRLIDEGFAFVDEPAGWPPAEVLRDLNSKGILNRSFNPISWTSPEVFHVYEVAHD